jgi:CHRD domain
MKVARMMFVAAVVAVSVAACDEEEFVAPVREQYVIPLLGTNERPNPVTTTATGSAVVTVMSPDSIEWTLYVSGIDSVTAGHFHAGDANVAGPVMFFVFSGPPTARGITGLLSSGMIRRSGSTFSGAFTYDSLLTRIRAGTTYLNVHTRRNGGGEIRGQVTK